MSDIILLFILLVGTLLLNRDTLRQDWGEWKQKD